jgi:cystathionine beta-lyase family protein involved in aluminum resistance
MDVDSIAGAVVKNAGVWGGTVSACDAYVAVRAASAVIPCAGVTVGIGGVSGASN